MEQFVVFSPPLPSQLSLCSERATFMEHAKYSRYQEVTLVDDMSCDTAWWVGQCSIQSLCSVGGAVLHTVTM